MCWTCPFSVQTLNDRYKLLSSFQTFTYTHTCWFLAWNENSKNSKFSMWMINVCINIKILNQNIIILICRTSPIIDSICFLQSTCIQSKPSLCLSFFFCLKNLFYSDVQHNTEENIFCYLYFIVTSNLQPFGIFRSEHRLIECLHKSFSL